MSNLTIGEMVEPVDDVGTLTVGSETVVGVGGPTSDTAGHPTVRCICKLDDIP